MRVFGHVLPRRPGPGKPAWPVLGFHGNRGIAETLLELLGQFLVARAIHYLDTDIVEHVRCCI